MNKLLEIKDVSVHLYTQHGVVQAVSDVDLSLGNKETLAIVGESGSGKSILCKSVMHLLPKTGRIESGEVLLEGKDIAKYSDRQMRKINGQEIAMIFQDPMTSLNPTMTVGNQIIEILKEHTKLSREEMQQRALELLNLVGISDPEKRLKQYPHQFSGGMRQRVVIAIALACNPKILIADEPTTALDVTIQAQILDLMKDLQNRLDTSIVLITHNMGVVANIAQKVAVMYGGRLVETGLVDEIFYESANPYTQGLLDSIPNVSRDEEKLKTIPGTPPDLTEPPKGCPFAPRCPKAMKVCLEYEPPRVDLSETHWSRCWLLDQRAKKSRNQAEEASRK